MGIKNLLMGLDKAQERGYKIEKMAGKKAAIDVSCWIYKGKWTLFHKYYNF